jgi:hypothetical protein
MSKCRYLFGSSDSKGRVAPDPRNSDVATRGFLHRAQPRFMKCEVVKCPRVRHMVTARGCMEKWKGAVSKAESACVGHRKGSTWLQDARIDSKKS